MIRFIILTTFLITAKGFCDPHTPPVDTENLGHFRRSHHGANWLYIPASPLMTWGVYELGEEISDDGWTYVGAYWGTAVVVSIGIVTYQHYTEPIVCINAGIIGNKPGSFLAYRF